MKLYNIILFRSFKDCNYDVFKAWYHRNKGKIEENFYHNDILMSGVVKERDGEVLEVLYLKYYADEKIKPECVLQIYSTGQKDFPDYTNFMSFLQNQQEKAIVNKILEKIIKTSKKTILNAKEYHSECLKIDACFNTPFVNFVTPQKKIKQEIKSVIQETIMENELSFVGVASVTMANSFKEMLVYKILEKLFGANDTNGIYYEFRERGWIYTGLSGYVIEKNFFYSGAMLKYHIGHEEEIIRKIEIFRVSEKEFENAKKDVLDDYKYSVFQYGLEFTLLPYKLQIKDISRIEQCLELITISEVRKKLDQIRVNGQMIRLKVM